MRHASDFIKEQLSSDDELRRLHLQDAIKSLFSQEYQVALLMLRDIINATCGFESLALQLGKSPKSIMRMLNAEGNPTCINLFSILDFLIKQEGGKIDVKYVA